jgi:hypothetical protein
VFLATLLVCIPARVWATDNPAAQQVLDSAQKPADLFRNATAPFELEIEFTAQSKVPTQGRLLLRWKAKDQWWSKVILGAYQQITIRSGEMEYTERNLDFTPMAVKELFNLLRIRQDFSPFIANKQKARTEQGVAFTCIQGQRSESKDPVHDICVEAVSHEVRSDEWQFAEEKRKQQFGDYSDFEGIRFPRKLELLLNGSGVLSAGVLRLQAASFDAALLVPPKDAIERRRCPGITPPVLLSKPEFPDDPALTGTTTASVTVLTDGSVGDVQVIASGGRLMDGPTVAALKNLKFKPATCGNDPVVFDSQITVNKITKKY